MLPLADQHRPGCGRGHHHRRRRRNLAAQAAFFVLGSLVIYICFGSSPSRTVDHGLESPARRHLLQTPGTATEDPAEKNTDGVQLAPEGDGGGDDPLFPPDLFTKEQRQDGAVVLHAIGILYMFYALALVCDEFFVPSLDVITDRLKITPDVAGATFMAAGGSAPELFTSIIGIFFAKNDVGIGTIVGSAVFNILFVIAACAFAAKEALSLTAWPLIRDVFFYSVSLVVLVVFFDDQFIYWYEALILFLWYGAYVGFMKFNEPVEDSLRSLFKLPKIARENKVRGVTLRQAEHRRGLFHLMNETINPGILNTSKRGSGPRGGGNQEKDGEELKPLNMMLAGGGGDLGGSKSGGRGIEACKEKLKEGIMIGEDPSGGGVGGINQLKSHLQVDGEQQQNGGQHAAESELTEVKKDGESAAAAARNDESEAGKNNSADLTAVSSTAAVIAPDSAASRTSVAEEEDGDPIDMSFPKNGGWKQIVIYLLSFPIMFPLYVTLPDTKNPKKTKYYPITFIGSIIWIAIYSYLMVWWTTIVGDAVGIPSVVMGLTFLAAGTSVPDLITSVLVAKQGKGDMAVSSSVGSNIFDVTVGLPVPWLLWTLIESQPVSVSSKGVGCSITLLFLMLIAVFLSILAFKWKMTKGMGALMMGLYVVFVVISLGFSYEWYVCPI